MLYTYGRIEIQFVHIAKRPPFDDPQLREELRTRLMTIPGVDLPPIEEAKRPGIDVSTLGNEIGRFTAAMDWAFEQANRTAATAD